MIRLKLFAIFIIVSVDGFSQNTIKNVQITNPIEQIRLIGELGLPLGTTLTIQGVVEDISSKGFKNGLNVTVKKINDSSIQQVITIPIFPYFGTFNDKLFKKIKKGLTYKLRVFESGEFVGIPQKSFKELNLMVQTTDFYFQNKLIVLTSEKVDLPNETSSNFIGRKALITGTANNENDTSFIFAKRERLRLIDFRKWKKTEIGKTAEVYGIIEKTEKKGTFNVRDGNPRLIKLEDQIGENVKLRGRAVSLNGYWWLNYRGTDIYVEKMEDLPNWTVNNHFRAIEVSGLLEQENLPRIDQIGIKSDRDKQLYYIIRRPSWKPIEQLLAAEDIEIKTED